MIKKLIEFIKSIRKRDLINAAIILVLLSLLCYSVNTCVDNKNQYRNNIDALTDTIKYHKGKNGNLVAEKLAFEATVSDLKTLNKKLYDKIDSLNVKPKTIVKTVYLEGEIQFLPQDTCYQIHHDTIYKGFAKDFNFNDQWRILEGSVQYKNDSLGISIDRDIVNFDYVVAMDKNNKIYISSSNPYVKYKEITGFTVPKGKEKHWFTGPAISGGYDPINKKASFNIGWSIGYGLIRW